MQIRGMPPNRLDFEHYIFEFFFLIASESHVQSVINQNKN
jgi:hypothetical protein